MSCTLPLQSLSTPLHLASLRGHADACLLLLGAGAEPGARDGEGKSALDLARDKGHAAVEEILGGRVSGQECVPYASLSWVVLCLKKLHYKLTLTERRTGSGPAATVHMPEDNEVVLLPIPCLCPCLCLLPAQTERVMRAAGCVASDGRAPPRLPLARTADEVG